MTINLSTTETSGGSTRAILTTMSRDLFVQLIKHLELSGSQSDWMWTELYNTLQERFSEIESLSWEGVCAEIEQLFWKLKRLMDNNFGLTSGAFDEMVMQLRRGDHKLFERVFLSHFQDCMQYLIKFCNATHQDAYDATMDAMLDFCERLQAGKIQYGNLRFLFTRMARQGYFKRKKRSGQAVSLESLDLEGGEEAEVDPEDLAVLQRAWKGLCTDCAQLLRQFYHAGIPLKDLAEASGRNPASVRKQKQRCVEKLRTLFLKHI